MAAIKTQTYEHLKTGKRDKYLGLAENKSTNSPEEMAVYMDLSGKLYVRKLSDFMDKFDLVAGLNE